jgi:Fuc2NAc and GlcNAc transferase
MSVLTLSIMFMVTLCLAIIISPIVLNIAEKANLNDTVNERSAHVKPTLRGGGLIFIFATATLLVANLIHHFLVIPPGFSLILYSSYACALIGFLDDKYTLPSSLRFFGQIALVVYPSLHLPLLFPHLSSVVQYSLYTISWVWFINLFNFMDGTDGYAAQEALCIFLFIAVISTELRGLSICLMAATFGFLKVNYPKASIFMGDAGSYFMGYLLFGLMIYSFTHHPYLLISCLIISMLFWLDATSTLIKRVIKKESFLKAHRSHWYQRLYNLGFSHLFIFWLGVATNSILLLLALAATTPGYSLLSLVLSFCLLLLVAFWIRRVEDSKFRLCND